MTYEERKQQVCNECGSAICGYRSRGLMDKCGYLQVVMQGWELGQEDTIDKACEWLEDNVFSSEQLDRNYSRKFRNAMEDEK